MAVTTFDGIDEVRAAVGTHLGHSDRVTVTQEQVDLFAEVTGAHQWVPVDSERGEAESPWLLGERRESDRLLSERSESKHGGPIAHGYLTLSLTNLFLPQVVDVQGVSLGVNRGTGKIRFPSPVPVGSRLRAGVELVAVDDVVRDGAVTGIDTTMVITVEREGADKPVCVVESLSRYLA